jgi:hypothetical protein
MHIREALNLPGRLAYYLLIIAGQAINEQRVRELRPLVNCLLPIAR